MDLQIVVPEREHVRSFIAKHHPCSPEETPSLKAGWKHAFCLDCLLPVCSSPGRIHP